MKGKPHSDKVWAIRNSENYEIWVIYKGINKSLDASIRKILPNSDSGLWTFGMIRDFTEMFAQKKKALSAFGRLKTLMGKCCKPPYLVKLLKLTPSLLQAHGKGNPKALSCRMPPQSKRVS